MENRFDFKRFVDYAKLHYWERRREYIVIVLVLFAFALIFMSKGLFSEIIYGNVHIEQDFIGTFYGLLFFTTFIFTARSLSSVKLSRYTMSDMLLPVSKVERCIFAVLNSTVVSYLLVSVIYIVVGSYIESLYFIGSDGVFYRGLFSFVAVPEGFVKNDFSVFSFNLSPFSSGLTSSTKFIYSMIFLSSYLYVIAAGLWSSVTFKTHFVIKSLLLHFGIFVIFNICLFSNIFSEGIYSINLSLSGKADILDRFDNLYVYLSTLLLIPSITYFVVTWFKLKRLEIFSN